jgi:hypothetical protein
MRIGYAVLKSGTIGDAVIASWVPALGPTLMDETNTAVVARLDRATQYSRDV